MTVDLLVRNAKIVTPEGTFPRETGIAVDDGTIVAVGQLDDLPEANNVLDADGNVLVPGIIDCHVHTRSPGQEWREDWETATRSAAAGGVTSLIGMPNTDPLIDSPDNVELAFDLIEENALVDAQQYALLSSENVDAVEALAETGVAGFKCFLVEGGQYDFSTPSDGELREAMEVLSNLDTRVGFHEENSSIVYHTVQRFQEEGRNHPRDQPRSRPVVAEIEAVSRICILSADTDCPVHMFHLSSGSAAEVVVDAKRRGVDVTAETMPHYLQFNEEILDEKGNAARVNPPIRTEEERQLLWDIGMGDGAIDCLATDHAPYTDEEKGAEDFFQNTWDVYSGFVGLETEVPAMMTLVNEGQLSLERWLDLHTRQPAKIWGMYPNKGSLQVGTDADFTIVNFDEKWTLDRHDLHSKSKVSPYDGETFTGRVETTVVRGEVVFDDGEVTGEPGYGEVVPVED